MTANGDPVGLDEAVDLLHRAAVAAPIERDLLVVSGTDAASYLQGQLSQDVEGMAIGATARSLLLQPQGKIDAWLRVHRRAEQVFWLDTDVSHGSAAAERLNRFKLRVEVTIEVATVSGLAIRGADAPTLRERASDLIPVDVATLDATWGGIAGFDVLGPSDGSGLADGDLAAELGVPLAVSEVAEAVRVIQGMPAMGHELDGSTIPAAAGIVDASVDFTKGCYVGQELVARIDSRGNNTPTRLHALRLSGPGDDAGAGAAGAAGGVPAGTDLVLDGEPVGAVTSAVDLPGGRSVGLGYLKRSVDAPATLSALDGRLTVEAVALPEG